MIRLKDQPDSPSYNTRIVPGPDNEDVSIIVSYEPGTILLINEDGNAVGGITEWDMENNWEEV